MSIRISLTDDEATTIYSLLDGTLHAMVDDQDNDLYRAMYSVRNKIVYAS